MISIYSEKEQNVDRSAVQYECCHGSKSHASLKDKNVLGTNQINYCLCPSADQPAGRSSQPQFLSSSSPWTEWHCSSGRICQARHLLLGASQELEHCDALCTQEKKKIWLQGHSNPAQKRKINIQTNKLKVLYSVNVIEPVDCFVSKYT